MRSLRSVTVLVLLISAAAAVPAAAAPDGQVTWGVHISLAPTWFDPAENPRIVTPFMVLYGLHDAMLKALPGNPLRRRSPSRGPYPPMGSRTSSSCAAV